MSYTYSSLCIKGIIYDWQVWFCVYWPIHAFYLITILLLFIGSLQELGISRLLYCRMVLQFVFHWTKLLYSIYPGHFTFRKVQSVTKVLTRPDNKDVYLI